MTVAPILTGLGTRSPRWSPTWPANVLTVGIGLFSAIALGAVAAKPLRGAELTGTDGVIVLACALRGLTVAMTQAAVRPWGSRVPGWLLLGGLWGAAAVQVVYPAAELVIKLLVLTGLVERTSLGATHTSPVAWFNLAMTIVIWAVPGVLMALSAVAYRRRTRVSALWAVLGVPGGLGFLLLLGLLIG
jgi:hypothetical protein